jgi:hypothetical protein
VYEGCIGLCGNTKDKKKTIHLTPGNAIVFHGYLVHAGSAYSKQNTRIFMYAGTSDCEYDDKLVNFVALETDEEDGDN